MEEGAVQTEASVVHPDSDISNPNGRARVLRRIGRGGFSDVYLLHWRGMAYALKIDSNKKRILNEIHTLSVFNHPAITKVVRFGLLDSCAYFVAPLLKISLFQLWAKSGCKLSARRIALVGVYMVEILAYIHSMGYVYRDVKPENIMIGYDNNVYLIDFGMCTRRSHVPGGVRAFAGTLRYAPIGVHNGCDYGRKDDMESLWYVLVFLSSGGKLPWISVESEGRVRVGRMKEETELEKIVETLRNGELWLTYIRHVRSMGIDDKPDYTFLKQCMFDIGVGQGNTVEKQDGSGSKWCCGLWC